MKGEGASTQQHTQISDKEQHTDHTANNYESYHKFNLIIFYYQFYQFILILLHNFTQLCIKCNNLY